MARVAVVPEPMDYPDSDGLPMAENESQFWPILYVGSALDRYYQDREDVYVVGNLLVYYQKAPPGQPISAAKSVSPALMVVLGAPKQVRSSYVLWQEPKAPDFVLEIASASTYRSDRGEKRVTYAGMGVSEYWQYDPVGSYLDPPLLGFRLVEGRYVPIPALTLAGGLLALRSEVLGLELAPEAGCAGPGGAALLRPGARGVPADLPGRSAGTPAGRGPVAADAGPFARRAGSAAGAGRRAPGTAATRWLRRREYSRAIWGDVAHHRTTPHFAPSWGS